MNAGKQSPSHLMAAAQTIAQAPCEDLSLPASEQLAVEK